MTPYWRRRVLRHTILATGSAAGAGVVALLFPGRLTVFRLSMGTAYMGLGLLALTLLLGPWNVLRAQPNPVSTDLRRDIGIWAVVAAVAHTVFGLQVHLPGQMWQYFFWAADQGHMIPLRYDWAGVANYPGLGSVLVLLMLLALSNDAALRRLGRPRWKALQRWNYAGFGLMVFHGTVYQVLEKRTVPWIVVFAGIVTIVVGTQIVGWRRRRGRS